MTLTSPSIEGRSRQMLLSILSLLLVSLLSAPLQAQEEENKADAMRTMLEKWVETRRLITKEKADWALGKDILKDRIEMIEEEIKSYREKIETAKKDLTKLDKEKLAKDEELKKLEGDAKVFVDAIKPLEGRITKLLVQLPDPIQEKVKLLSNRIPKADAKEIKFNLSERFQNVVGVLDQVNKFNTDITVTEETRELGNGTSALVSSMYIGISQGYYANQDGTTGGVGYASEGRWIWKPKKESAADIFKAIKILNNEEVAGYVQLPLEIR